MFSEYLTGCSFTQCSLQDFAIGGYILECTEYLHHNLMCFVIQVVLVALVVYNLLLKIHQKGGYNGCGLR